jgi:hypothetical protein
MQSAMRTTISLDPDLAARLRRLAAERGTSFTAAVNSALRAGLEAARRDTGRYEEQTVSLGVRPGIDATKALRLAGQLEDEATVRKLELRK